jgi:hypothetical protein
LHCSRHDEEGLRHGPVEMCGGPGGLRPHVKPVQAEAPVRGRTSCQVAHHCTRTDGQVGLFARYAKLRTDFASVTEIAGIGIGPSVTAPTQRA